MEAETPETKGAPATLHVAYCIDVQGGGANQFNDQLFVSVKSLRDSRQPGDNIICHILYAHVSVELMERLHALDSDGFKVTTQHIEDGDMVYWQRFTRYDPRAQVRSWGGIVYARIWMPLFLKNCDRCIYLDADTMVRSSLRDLWNTDLGDCWLGMNMGSVPEYGYNSGVMLMDLKAMRADESLYPRLGKFMEEHAREYKCPDQTVINRFFVGKIKDIAREWNFPPSPGVADPALKKARIWHFYNGNQKPYRLAGDDFGRALVDWNNLLVGV
jgi:lipopolysaccharide biosynthesis glycosyltransferase